MFACMYACTHVRVYACKQASKRASMQACKRASSMQACKRASKHAACMYGSSLSFVCIVTKCNVIVYNVIYRGANGMSCSISMYIYIYTSMCTYMMCIHILTPVCMYGRIYGCLLVCFWAMKGCCPPESSVTH